MNKDKLNWLKDFETHISAVCFIVIGVMLTVQVISRYVFRHSFVVFEEVATQLYVLMTYTGIAAAVTKRKHLSITALPDALPFKARKVLLILENVIFMVFCAWITPPFLKYITSLGNAKLDVSRIPVKYFYYIIPVCMLLTIVRLIQDSIRLWGENEEKLGETTPSIDLDALERIAAARKEADAIAAEQEKKEGGAK